MVEPETAKSAARAAEAVDPDEVLRFARALISAPSENPGGTEDAAAAEAVRILEELAAQPQIVRSEAGRPSVVARIGSGAGPKLAFNGHLDVVPAGSVDTWAHGPWNGDVEDGRLIGRGAADMKGPVAAALAAAAAIVRSGVALAGTLDLHLAADEELAGTHGTKILWEQGFLDQDAAIIGEPTEMELALAERGGAWFTATAKGRASHGSRPHLGVNAITSMARFLLRLPEVLPDSQHPLCGGPTVNAALIKGGSAPNVVPDRCEIDIDRRTIPGETDREKVRAPFLALTESLRAQDPDIDIDVRLREWTEAAEAPADSLIAQVSRQAVTDVLGATPPNVGFSGITDARFYINQAKIPAVILGPGSMSVAHTANEWIDVAEMVDAARVYARIFVGFLGAA